jgi:hypothetical protein
LLTKSEFLQKLGNKSILVVKIKMQVKHCTDGQLKVPFHEENNGSIPEKQIEQLVVLAHAPL